MADCSGGSKSSKPPVEQAEENLRNSTEDWAGNQPALKLEQRPVQECSQGGINGFLPCFSVPGGIEASVQLELGGGAAHSSLESAPSDVQPAAPPISGGAGAGSKQLVDAAAASGAGSASEGQAAEAADAAAVSRSTGSTPQRSAAAERRAQAEGNETAGSPSQLEPAAGTVSVTASSTSSELLPQRDARLAERSEADGDAACLQLLAVSEEDGPSAAPDRAASRALPTLLSDLASGQFSKQTSSAALAVTWPAAATMHGEASSQQLQHRDSALSAHCAVLTGKAATSSSSDAEAAQPVDGLAEVLPGEEPAGHSVQAEGRSAQQPANAAAVLSGTGAAMSSICAEAGRAEQPIDAPAAAGQLVSNAQQPVNEPAAPGSPLSNRHRAASNDGMVTSAEHATRRLAPGLPSWCSLRWLLLLGFVLIAILGARLRLPAPHASPVPSYSTLRYSRKQVRHPSVCPKSRAGCSCVTLGFSSEFGSICCCVQY